jgi:predicted nucleic acid-binding protein
MKRRFIDTWFWISLIVETEPFHQKATEFLLKYGYKGDEFYTSNSILAETTSGILYSKRLIKAPEKKLIPKYAFEFLEKFSKMVTSGEVKVLMADQVLIGQSLDLLKKQFRKIPDLSYFDCESVIHCKQSKIFEILTADDHFEYLDLPIDKDWKEFKEQKF